MNIQIKRLIKKYLIGITERVSTESLFDLICAANKIVSNQNEGVYNKNELSEYFEDCVKELMSIYKQKKTREIMKEVKQILNSDL